MKTYSIKINGKAYEVAIGEQEGDRLPVQVNGKSYEVQVEGSPCAASSPAVSAAPAASPAPNAATPAPAQKPAATAQGGGEQVNAPLPGVIIEVCVKVGDTLQAGQKVAVLEAMKMENEITAAKAGTVSAIHVNKGDSVLEGAPIVTLA